MEDEDALAFAISLIDPEVNVEHIDQSLVPEELRPFGPGQLFQFIVSLAHSQDHILSGKTRLLEPSVRRLTPTASDLAAAARAILDWPAGFVKYADNLRYHNTENYRNRLDPELTQTKARWRDPISTVVHGLDRGMRETILSTAQAERQTTLYGAMGRLMSNSEDTVSQSAIDAEIWQLKNRKTGLRQLYAAADLCRKTEASMPATVAIHLTLSSSKSVRDFSTRVGIPLPFIADLIRDNLVEEFEPVMESILGREGTPPIATLEARIMQIASEGPLPPKALSLVDACASISRRRTNPWSTCLQAITAGDIPVRRVEKVSSPLVGRIYVLEFDRLRSLLDELPERHDLLQLPADVRTVGSVLGLSKASVLNLRRPGILQTELTLRDLWSFRDIFISATEVQRRLMFNDIHLDTKIINSQLDAAEVERVGYKRRRQTITLRDRRAVEAFYGDQLAPMV